MSVTDIDDRDVELGDEDEEGLEKVDNEKRMKEEEENKKAKERQAFLENLYVLICMIIIVAMAVVIVIVKINIYSSEPDVTFIPLNQQVTKKNLIYDRIRKSPTDFASRVCIKEPHEIFLLPQSA